MSDSAESRKVESHAEEEVAGSTAVAEKENVAETTTGSVFETREQPGTKFSFLNQVDSEWLKFRSVRTSFWLMFTGILLTIIVAIGVGVIYTMIIDNAQSKQHISTAQIQTALASTMFPFAMTGLIPVLVVTFGLLGVFSFSTEYTTGTIRTTLVTSPRRVTVYLAKMTLMFIVMFLAAFVMIAIAAGIVWLFFGTRGIDPFPPNGLVLREMVSASGYVALLSLIALAIGAIVRNSAGAVCIYLAIVLVLPAAFAGISGLVTQVAPWFATVNDWLPTNAGSAMMRLTDPGQTALIQAQSVGDSSPFPALAGLAILIGYVVVFNVIGMLLLKRRDVR